MFENISDALLQAGYNFNDEQHKQLSEYLKHLSHWNKQVNLTSVHPDNFVTHHLLDSLSVLHELKGVNILDMGTGGGLPGIPLAIAVPAYRFTLLDGRNKKIQFLEYVKSALQLSNLHPLHQRMEDHLPPVKYDTVITRAFAGLDCIYWLAQPQLANYGRIIAMKGRLPVDELKQLDHIGVHYEVKSIDVHGLDGQRHIVLM